MKTEHPQGMFHGPQKKKKNYPGRYSRMQCDAIYYLRLEKYNDILVIFGSCRFGQVRARAFYRQDTRQSQNISMSKKKKISFTLPAP